MGDGSVKLDFGLSSATLDPAVRQLWPFDFALIYSVNLSPGSLSTSLVVTNDGSEPFEFQALMHTYLRVNVSGLLSAPGIPIVLSLRVQCD